MQFEAEQPLAPPLLVWLASAALTAATMCPLIALHNSQERATASLLADCTRNVLAQGRPGDIRVIGLGSSLLRAATPARDDVAAAPLHWSRVIKNGVGLTHLRASLALIEGAPPDVLVIEKNLLATTPQADVVNGVRRGVMYVFENILSMMDGRVDPLQALGAAQTQDVPCEDQLRPMTDAQMARLEHSLRRSYEESPDPAFVAALLRLAHRGVHVMIIDIPRSVPIERINEEVKHRWFARLQQMLPPGPHLSYHTGPSYSQSNLYCDARHLNATGAKLFRAWWWNELRQAQKAMR